MFQPYFEDKEKGGLFHAVSEDWSRVVDDQKISEEQFSAARISVIGAMISHDHDAIIDAGKAVDEVITRFEDTKNGGYFFSADKNWNITRREKNLDKTSDIFGVLMHLYEVSYNDAYLLKALGFLDVALDHAWDKQHGGFFSLYTENWDVAADIKDLATQCSMLQHLNGSWKDGMDSPFGARSAYHKQRARELGDIILDKAADKLHGGFYTSFTRDWKPASKDKDIAELASLALTLYFHYHNLGPSIWGPRRGSHAYTGRPYAAVYSYRGPAPSVEPVSEYAYQFGKKVIEIGDILVDHAWDKEHGGFCTTVSEDLRPHDTTKHISTQINCLLALNVAYRLTGASRFQKRCAEAIKTIEDKCFDSNNAGVYASFTRDWTPTSRDKICGPNLIVGGIMSMIGPVAQGLDVTRNTRALWIDPFCQKVGAGESAQFTVTVQNQGFEKEKIRIGGLTAPHRWLNPGDSTFDLAPHEIKKFTLTVTPPKDMPPGDYPFEITCMGAGEVAEYVSRSGKITILAE